MTNRCLQANILKLSKRHKSLDLFHRIGLNVGHIIITGEIIQRIVL